MTVPLRHAGPSDAAEITALFLACWRTSYAGILPDEAVAGMTEAGARALWDRALANPDGPVLGAVDPKDGRVLGVTRYALLPRGDRTGASLPGDHGLQASAVAEAPSAEAMTARAGVVHSLYVLPGTQGRGIGTVLLDGAATALHALGATHATLWVFEANTPSVTFYRRRGWLPDGARRTQPELANAPQIRLARTLDGMPRP